MIAPLPQDPFAKALRAAAVPLRGPNDLGALLEVLGDARIVMLGEATHGTSEFYEWRRTISEYLIRECGFSFIAVEGDWPDCHRVHQHITTGVGSPRDALAGYRRFPTWMWGNEEVLELVEWMRGFNDAVRYHDNRRPVGFHGLDVYSMYDSMRLVVAYLRKVDPPAADAARRAYACFEPYNRDPHEYAYATRLVSANCESNVRAALAHIERLERLYTATRPNHEDPKEAYFDARMNARVTRNAEAYYRTMLAGDAPSWNVRDRHMMETLSLLLEHYGDDSRAIVWAHNTHIGDYRATNMARSGYVNLGGLAREHYGADAVRLIGFGTHHGTVIAADAWGESHETISIPPAAPGSLEDELHRLGMAQLIVPLRTLPAALRDLLRRELGHRAIGVVYHPHAERPGNYVPTRLVDRYDAFIFIDETHAVHPLELAADLAEEPEAWPSGL